ncbi:MAG: hypothetical protein U1E11_02905 [Dethiobacteria bacterium]|nr:hypothetical protein [Dethiobacteria bacterium]
MVKNSINHYPKWNLDRDGLEPVVAALSALNYQPEKFLWLAALRMARSPMLVNDLLAYIAANQPPLDMNGGKPKMLFRTLPGGYCVASLTAAFKFKLVGSFLFGSELIANESKALAILERFKKEGRWKAMNDGAAALSNPAANHGAAYPALPEPFMHVKKRYAALKEDLAKGKIASETFRSAVYDLRFQDSAGNWWQINEDGVGWLRWNGKAWIAASPVEKGIQ